MHVYVAVYGHIYSCIQHLGALKVCKTPSQSIHTQETGASYTKLAHIWCSATQLPCKGL